MDKEEEKIKDDCRRRNGEQKEGEGEDVRKSGE